LHAAEPARFYIGDLVEFERDCLVMEIIEEKFASSIKIEAEVCISDKI
jgi:hypothetical protein